MTKNALSEARRKNIFYELTKPQDNYLENYLDYQEKQQLAYKKIAEYYNLDEKIIRKIAVEGAQKGWVYEIK